MNQLDARGLSCPEPVLLLRRAMASGEAAYQIVVDNQAARENVSRYAQNQGYQVTVAQREGEYILTATRA